MKTEKGGVSKEHNNNNKKWKTKKKTESQLQEITEIK